MAKKKPDFDLPAPEIIAEGVPPDAAIEFWKWRAKLTDEEAKALGEEVRHRAFYVTGLAKHDLVQLVSDGLEEALKSGETLPQFKERIMAAIQTQGWHDYRVENIFRTNMQTAYSAGRYKKMQAVKASRPYWQYIAVMDKRVRPSHAILHEKVYPADHEFWAANYPPNGFRCRCGVRTLSARQVEKQGLTVETDMPKAGVWTDPKTGMEHFVHFPGADKGFRNNPGKDWAESGLDLKKHGLKDTAPPVPKKEPLTQKKLEADIASIDTLIKAAGDKQSIAELEAKKAELQELLDKKTAQAAKKKLNAQNKKLEQQIADFPVKTYSGIWQADVTTADWAAKAGSIQAKKDYFESKLHFGSLTPEETAKFKGLLQDLEEFDAQGQQFHDLQKKQKNVQDSLSKLKNGGKEDPNPYSESRKEAALWAQTPQEADDVLREKCGEVWRKASKAEKDAIYAYTKGSGGFNRPLRGHDGWWGNFKGVGKVDLNNEGRGAAIQHLTNLINRSTYDRDIWLQRGIETAEGAASFLGVPVEALKTWPLEKLQSLIGKEITEHAFTSCGSAKGQGFGGYIFRIYCPRGTKMMYAEPFSHFGDGAKRKWDGKKAQASFGYEDETIIQRGTTYKIMKVEKAGKKISFEIAVTNQI
ncbi:MAG TPA: minor capsid protein [Candidatus Desulfovibrio intestinavium]|uniref:Minor capsid protein n=1 Tax=Candidatus Desulfovibrio intestinavium TaxID=2838534 RepID=A0A9D2HQB2_9BACT|nr:minor capsid protein [Candidatus Desulfovibrio intestinavium]